MVICMNQRLMGFNTYIRTRGGHVIVDDYSSGMYVAFMTESAAA
jgi:hypothetical protein